MYSYQTQRSKLFTEDGQVFFLKVRDKVKELLKQAGAVRINEVNTATCGDSWLVLASFDRLVELQELQEISPPNSWGQYRIFTHFHNH